MEPRAKTSSPSAPLGEARKWAKFAWVASAILAGSTLACSGEGGGPTDPPAPSNATVRASVSVDGNPAAGITVQLFPPGSTQPLATRTTDAEGVALFEGLEPGSFDVEVDVPAELGVPNDEDTRKRVTTTAGGTAVVSFDLVVIGPPEFGEVTDVDGNVYRTVTIGDQTWMADNLRVARYRNGDPIGEARTDEAWSLAGEERRGAWSHYDNDPANEELYGKLYNNFAVLDPRGLCPEGWRVPTDGDWMRLERFIGVSGVELTLRWEENPPGFRGNDAGKLMSPRTEPMPHPRWDGSNPIANNRTGFSALPGGVRAGPFGIEGTFRFRGEEATFWTSSAGTGDDDHWARFMASGRQGIIRRQADLANFGFSVRCLRN